MDIAHYLRMKDLLSQTFNGEDRLNAVVSDITKVLKKYNLDAMPGTAVDTFDYTMETIHISKFDLSVYRR